MASEVSKRKKAMQELRHNIDLLLNADDKDYLHYVLKEYSTYKDVDQLVLALCSCLDNPRKLNLLRNIRTLVPSAHLSRFDKLAPYHLMEDPYVAPSATVRSKMNVRTIVLVSRRGDSLGFSIRGGKEHGLGVFVSQVDVESDAYANGLRVGDRLVDVNGLSFDRIAHSNAVRVLKSDGRLEITVQSTGKIPAHHKGNDSHSWLDTRGRPLSTATVSDTSSSSEGVNAEQRVKSGHETRKISLTRTEGELGLSIRGGSEFGLGIYVSNVAEGSVAAANGIELGDRIVDVNGVSFLTIEHGEAVETIRRAQQLFITVKNSGRVPRTTSGPGQSRWIKYSDSGRSSRNSSYSVSSSLPDMRTPNSIEFLETSRDSNRMSADSKLDRQQSLSLREPKARSHALASFSALKARGQRLAGSIIRRTSSLRRSRSNSEGRTLDDVRREHEATMANAASTHGGSGREQSSRSEQRDGDSDGSIQYAPAARMFSRGVGSQVMWTESRHSRARNMLDAAASKALVHEETAAFWLHFDRYEKEQNVENLVVSILPILNTAEKLELLKELRPLLTARHIEKFDELVSRKEATMLRERVRPAVGPGAEASHRAVHSQLMAAIQGQGKQSLKKRVTANFDKEKRRDGDSNGSPPRGHSQQKMGVFASSSALTMLEKASKIELSPELRRRDSFMAWKDESSAASRQTKFEKDLQIALVLPKRRRNLGLVIHGGVDTPQPEVLIQAVKEESIAADDGFLRAGFEIVSIDGFQVKGRTHAEAVKIISQAVASENPTLELVVVPPREY